MLWWVILAAAAGCYAFKWAGLSVPAAVLGNPMVQWIAASLPIALLAALIASQTFSSGEHLVIDARLAGVAVAGVAVWRRWPFLLVVALAAATTALLRWWLPGS